jgi:hypothetical protein
VGLFFVFLPYAPRGNVVAAKFFCHRLSLLALGLTFIVGIPLLTAGYFSFNSKRKVTKRMPFLDVFYSCLLNNFLMHRLGQHIHVQSRA